MVKTPVVANYDIDVLLPINSYLYAQDAVINHGYDYINPFTNPPGANYISQENKKEILETMDITKVRPLRNGLAGCGFVVFLNVQSYLSVNGENLDFKSYGPEDKERFYKFVKLGYKTTNYYNRNPNDIDYFSIETDGFNGMVYHLEHVRGEDSSHLNKYYQHNIKLFRLLTNISGDDLNKYYFQKVKFDHQQYLGIYPELHTYTTFELYKHWQIKGRIDKVPFPKINNFVTMSNIGLNGRLGNQIFQYTVLLIYSILHSVKIKIPIIKTNDKYQNFRLDELFNLDYEQLSTTDTLNNRYIEPHFHHDTSAYEYKSGNTDMIGYFQSYKYMSGFEKLLMNKFKIKENLLNYATEFIRDIKNNEVVNVIGIHVRRGDYIKPDTPYNSFGNDILPFVMNYFDTKYQDCIYLIVSDDIEWCKEHMKNKKIIYSENNTDLHDFVILTKCDHIVSSSSTFSWWAGFLNPNPKKEILLPTPWFNQNHALSKSIVELCNPEWNNWKVFDRLKMEFI